MAAIVMKLREEIHLPKRSLPMYLTCGLLPLTILFVLEFILFHSATSALNGFLTITILEPNWIEPYYN